jgi:hypothetical protein
MSSSYRQGTELPSVQIVDFDPTVGDGVSNGTPNLFLIRTDVPSLYYYKGPLDTDWILLGAASSIPNPSELAYYYDDFVNGKSFATPSGFGSTLVGSVLREATTGAVANINTVDGNSFGVIDLAVVPGGDVEQGISFNPSASVLPFNTSTGPTTGDFSCEWRVLLDSVPDATYAAAAGINDDPTQFGPYTSLMFEVNFGVYSSINWFINGIDTGVPGTTDWVRLKVVVPAPGNDALCYIDDVLVVTIPNGAQNDAWAPLVQIQIPGSGLLSHAMLVDYVNVVWPLDRT